MPQLTLRRLILLYLPLLVTLTGCPLILLTGAAAGAAVYSLGALSATRNITLDQAWNAGLQAFNDLDIAIAGKERDGLTGEIVGIGAGNTKIRIHLKKLFEDVTKVTIRVGFFGDELQSRIIWGKMETHFNRPPAHTRPVLP